MIFLDNETTGLIKPMTTPLALQPYITEHAAVKVDDDFNVLATLTFQCKPPVPVPPEVTKITGISDATLKDAKPFSAYYKPLCDFYLGETTLVAHNAKFDTGVMSFELTRLGKAIQFPWPPNHVCTVERSQSILNKYMRLEALHKHYFGTDPEQKHRALDDVMLLIKVARRMREEGLL